MLTIDDKKATANEVAKYYIHHYGEGAHTAFANDQYYGMMGNQGPTRKEEQEVHDAICKHLKRVADFLGISKIERKLRNK